MMDMDVVMERAKQLAQEKAVESLADSMREGLSWKLREKIGEQVEQEFEEHIKPIIAKELEARRPEIAALLAEQVVIACNKAAEMAGERMLNNVTKTYGAVDKMVRAIAGDAY